MYIEYDADDLNFSSRIHATPDNIAHILDRYKVIDRIRQVRFRCQQPLRIRYISTDDGPIPISPYTPDGFFASQEVSTVDFLLDATIFLYENGTIIRWFPEQNLPAWIRQIIDQHCIDIKPIIIGTAAHYLPVLKQEAKDTVKHNAIRHARIMIGNAEAILTFFNEII